MSTRLPRGWQSSQWLPAPALPASKPSMRPGMWLQVAELRQLFEEYGGRRDWLDVISGSLEEGAFKRSQVARQLKAMGLKRGQLTERQVRR